MELEQLIKDIRTFCEERGWRQFHNPKDLATTLSIEAAELQELFLWKKGSEIDQVIVDKREKSNRKLPTLRFICLILWMSSISI